MMGQPKYTHHMLFFIINIMKMLLLTIASTTHSVDLELPAEVPLGSILPALVKFCVQKPEIPAYSTRYSLWKAENNTPLAPQRSLLEADIVDGEVLHLRLPNEQEQEQVRPQTFQPETIRPGEESGGIGVRWKPLD